MQTRLVCWMAVWVAAAWPMSAVAQQQQSPLELRPGISRSGVGFYAPGQWGEVRSAVVNHQRVPRSPLLVLSTDASENVQFAKRVWVPARSRRYTTMPIVLSRMPRDGNAGVEVAARLLDDRGDREFAILPRPDIGALNVREPGFETAVLAGTDDATIAMSSALREAAGLSPTTAYLSDDTAPSAASAWEAIEMLVISREHPRLDPVQMEAIRRWLIGGGRLWIDLERVDPAFARRLLPGDWNVTVLDRVELTDFRIDGGSEPGLEPGEPDPRRVRADYPFHMIRVVAPDMQVIHSVNGYPASLRKGVGQGELLVTTLEASAWLTDDQKASHAMRDLLWLTRREPGGETDRPVAPVLSALAREQIGYSVLSRTPVMVVLGVFTLALLGGGLMLARGDRLALMGWVAPVLAVAAALVILVMGLRRQTRDPFTLASSQWVRVADDQPYASVESLLSIYTPPGAPRDDATLRGEGSVAWPDLSAHGGKTIRLLWVDGRTWTFPNLNLGDGSVQTASRRGVEFLHEPITAVLRFGAEGLTGHVESGPVGQLEDAIILARGGVHPGKLPLRLDAGGDFTAPLVDPLGDDQFFTVSTLGQSQAVHQEAYRRLMEVPGFPEQPMLLGWARGLDLGVTLSDAAERRSAALVAIPLDIETPEPGEPVAAPAAFLSMSPFRDPRDKYSGAPIYDERNHEWVTNVSQSQIVLMRFTLPEALRGLRVESARIGFDLDAPGRPYAVVVYGGGEVREVAAGESPMGTHTVKLSGADAPVNENGAVVVGLRIGEADDPSNPEPWSLTRLEVAVSGTMGPASSPRHEVAPPPNQTP